VHLHCRPCTSTAALQSLTKPHPLLHARVIRARGGMLSHIHRPDAVLQRNNVLPPDMSVPVPIKLVYVCCRYADLEGCLRHCKHHPLSEGLGLHHKCCNTGTSLIPNAASTACAASGCNATQCCAPSLTTCAAANISCTGSVVVPGASCYLAATGATPACTPDTCCRKTCLSQAGVAAFTCPSGKHSSHP
jgi:hypothetical protein